MSLTSPARVRPYIPLPPALPPILDGRTRIAAADFFTLAGRGRALTSPPPFRDGDDVLCPKGNEWMRHNARWTIPHHPDGPTVTDETVTRWWHQRHQPGSQFALVHRLTPHETHLINAPRYTTHTYEYDHPTGESTRYTHKQVPGEWLRTAATHMTLPVFLELPSGIVTFYSRIATGVVFLPDS
ncbi:hypothetical protein [Streptomyces griseorubiginosus]|uniref:hypothetical protein n=1 Tax=Streptomyces griseorubiginosus TaxID=67304 RepID=UPI0036EB0C82